MLRVVKLGGSLLDLPDLVGRLRAWLVQQPLGDTILVVGGAARVDAIRRTQKADGLTDSAAHWLAIRAMATQAEMLRSALPEAALLTDIFQARDASVRPVHGFGFSSPHRFMRDALTATLATPLPESWDVTSDSIAARVAELCDADELVLLKSTPPPAKSFAELAELGYVDQFFTEGARKLALGAVCRLLRARSSLP